MARPLRVEYPGALYHVISRGNAGQNIYTDDKDRKKHLELLEKNLVLHNVFCHAYCLMGNHYHLLIETPDANLSSFMRDFNRDYPQWFNVRHKRSGHLYQDRYKSYLVEKEGYLFSVLRYIVLNPVRAKLVDHPGKWQWSSYQAMVGKTTTSTWLDTASLSQWFGGNAKEAIQRFKMFVAEESSEENPHDKAINGFIIGSPQFVTDIWKQVKERDIGEEIPRQQRLVGRPSLEEIFNDVQTRGDRDKAIRFARLSCGYLTTEIADHIGLHRTLVGKISRGVYNR